MYIYNIQTVDDILRMCVYIYMNIHGRSHIFICIYIYLYSNINHIPYYILVLSFFSPDLSTSTGAYKHQPRPLRAGDAFRVSGEIWSPTKAGNAQGTFRAARHGGDSVVKICYVRVSINGGSVVKTIINHCDMRFFF